MKIINTANFRVPKDGSIKMEGIENPAYLDLDDKVKLFQQILSSEELLKKDLPSEVLTEEDLSSVALA